MKRRAFSLTEILVAIAILAVLAALSFPIFMQGIAKARETEGLSRLQTVGRAVMLFTSDNNGVYPNSGTGSPVWYRQIEGYGLTHSLPTSLDPSLYSPLNDKDGTGGWPNHNPDFGLNREVAGYLDAEKRSANVRHPSNVILLANTGASGDANRGDFRFLPARYLFGSGPLPNANSYTGVGWLAFRYPEPTGNRQDMTTSRTHAFFCDGHVEVISFDDERLETTDGRRRLWDPSY